MKIKRLELEGFKSFANKTVFEFNHQIVGIVGPNGCGKSNIVDSIRWVLGVQSAKALRGKEMSDVIYSGGISGKAAKFTQVSLTFDNSDHTIKTEYDEVQISRKLHSDGKSEYFINNSPARLKDIRTLFQDTGIGVSSYFIMEQGKVDSLVLTTSQERRKIFEEAAGISKFKTRRNEALNRLERVEQNLARLRDVIEEVKGQVKKVKGQAAKAHKYKEHSKILTKRKIERALYKFRELTDMRENLLDSTAKYSTEVQDFSTGLYEKRVNLEKLEVVRNEIHAEFASLQQKVFESEKKYESNFQQINFNKQRISEFEKQSEQAEKRILEIKGLRSQLLSDASGVQNEVDEFEQTKIELEQKMNALKDREKSSNDELTSKQNENKELNDTWVSTSRSKNELHNQIVEIESDIKAVSQRVANADRVITERKSKVDFLNGQLRNIEEEITALNTEISKRKQDFDATNKKLHEIETQQDGVEKIIDSRRMELSAKKSKLETLEKFLSDKSGTSTGNKAITEDIELMTRFKVVGELCDIFTVKSNYAPVIETLLGDFSDSLIVKTQSAAFDALDYLGKHGFGGVQLIVEEMLQKNTEIYDADESEFIEGVAFDLVKIKNKKHEKIMAALLGKTIVVSDINAAKELIGKIPEDIGIITMNREFLRMPAFFSGRPEETGIITIKAQIDLLKTEISADEKEIEHLQVKQAELEKSIDVIQESSQELTQKLKDLENQVAGRTSAAESHRNQTADIEKDIEVFSREKADSEKELLQLANDVKSKKSEEAEINKKLATLDDTKDEIESNLVKMSRRMSKLRDEINDLKIDLAEISGEYKNRKALIANIEDKLNLYETEDEDLQLKIKEYKILKETAIKEIESSDSFVAAAKEEIDSLKQDTDALTDKKDSIENEFQSVRADFDKHQNESQSMQNKLTEMKVKNDTSFERLQELKSTSESELNIDLEEVTRTYVAEIPPINEIEDEIKSIEDNIRKLGNINQEAIDELEDLTKKNDFLGNQEHDLLDARNKLRDVLVALETKSQELFIETFDSVRENFNKLFRKLFDGGSAEVFLEDPNDILNSGIEIRTTLPGTKPMMLSLLSGGERAMTAIALLFSIFLSKPSPFCILDEVDAPLDEANVNRYCAMLKEFSETTQFLTVTHSRISMANTEILYGITMPRAGISTKIAIELEHITDIIDEDELAD